MSFKDIEVAQVARATKEVIKGKGETWSEAEECCARGK
jgi:hypothetical protein